MGCRVMSERTVFSFEVADLSGHPPTVRDGSGKSIGGDTDPDTGSVASRRTSARIFLPFGGTETRLHEPWRPNGPPCLPATCQSN